MVDEADAEKSSNDARKLVLKPRELVPIETSLGRFFARHLTVGDIKFFNEYFVEKKDKESTNLKTLGQRLLGVLVCSDKDAGRTPALTEEVYSKLSVEDIKALAEGVGKACNVILPSDEQPLEALGSAMFDQMLEQAKSTAEIKRMLDSNFSSISATVKAALGENLAGISAIRESLKMSTAVEAMWKAQESRERLFGNPTKDLTGTSIALEAVRRFQEDQNKLTAHLPKDPLSQINGWPDFATPPVSGPSSFLPPIPKTDETPIGRAAIASEQSALQLQEVSGLIGQMTAQLGELHTLFLIDVIPQWVKNLKDDAQSTNTSIGLAKKAIYWSIGATVLMTCWQIWVAREYKHENDKQQETSEALVRKQLDVSQALSRQLAGDSKRLQEEISQLNQTIAELRDARATEMSRPKVNNPQR